MKSSPRAARRSTFFRFAGFAERLRVNPNAGDEAIQSVALCECATVSTSTTGRPNSRRKVSAVRDVNCECGDGGDGDSEVFNDNDECNPTPGSVPFSKVISSLSIYFLRVRCYEFATSHGTHMENSLDFESKIQRRNAENSAEASNNNSDNI